MKRIDWTRWAAIAEIMSSVAILVTLLYLAIQTRQQALQNEQLAIQTEQNTSAILAAGRQSVLQTELDFIYKNLDYPEVYAGQIPSIDDNLDEVEKIRTVVMAYALFRMRETAWLQFQAGAIDESVWEAYMRGFARLIDQDPYARGAWEATSDLYDEEFVRVANESIRSSAE